MAKHLRCCPSLFAVGRDRRVGDKVSGRVNRVSEQLARAGELSVAGAPRSGDEEGEVAVLQDERAELACTAREDEEAGVDVLRDP
jgi:hypothetical protein